MTDTKFGLSDELFKSDFSWESNAAAISPPRDSALVYQLERYRPKLQQRNSVSHWQAQVLGKVLQLGDFPASWDSYGAKPLRHNTALFPILVLAKSIQAATPLP